ncbi:site-specific integrase [Neptunomonas sp.]|jgi:site-specific recombinase XerD|uniref:tyrosine-type recombinase/integrase n=1 Tax=Neptunomonas sp. TaxID=1971898 RepID=UPI0025EBB2F0|nr:site-specific integrase [Neptunomonas sp.]
MPTANQIKLFNGDQRLFLTTEERHRFRNAVASLDTIERCFCRTLYYTGCKISEALVIYPNQVNIRQGTIRLGGNQKKLRERLVPIPQIFSIELQVYLLANITAEHRPLWSFSRITGYRYIKKVMRKAGIEGGYATPNGLRHSFAISCLEVNPRVPIKFIQQLLGHKSIDLTLSYLKAEQSVNYDQCMTQIWESI